MKWLENALDTYMREPMCRYWYRSGLVIGFVTGLIYAWTI